VDDDAGEQSERGDRPEQPGGRPVETASVSTPAFQSPLRNAAVGSTCEPMRQTNRESTGRNVGST